MAHRNYTARLHALCSRDCRRRIAGNARTARYYLAAGQPNRALRFSGLAEREAARTNNWEFLTFLWNYLDCR
jgi:hypothetical protein